MLARNGVLMAACALGLRRLAIVSEYERQGELVSRIYSN